jgi:hypothetical protein
VGLGWLAQGESRVDGLETGGYQQVIIPVESRVLNTAGWGCKKLWKIAGIETEKARGIGIGIRANEVIGTGTESNANSNVSEKAI